MERSPPPFFKQGPSAQARLGFFAVLAIALLVLDVRFKMLDQLRLALGTVLYPVQTVLLTPRDMWRGGTSYFVNQRTLQNENAALKLAVIQLGLQAQRNVQLELENGQLKRLHTLRESRYPQSVIAEILYETRDPFVRRLALSKGSQQGVAAGMPVLDQQGIVGQITRVFPFSSEMRLITDKEQAIPVQVARNGLRAIAYGGQQAEMLEIRFIASNADIQPNDLLITSGIDGIYPAGLAVAQVLQVERSGNFGFAKIWCKPVTGVQQHRHLLILLAKNDHPEPLPKDGTHLERKTSPSHRSTIKNPSSISASSTQGEQRP